MNHLPPMRFWLGNFDAEIHIGNNTVLTKLYIPSNINTEKEHLRTVILGRQKWAGFRQIDKVDKVKGHKILRNLHLTFVPCSASQE